MPNYIVSINYPTRRTVSDSGNVIDFRVDRLKICSSMDESIDFARRYRTNMKKKDTVYIIDQSGSSEKSVYYVTLTGMGHIV